MSASSGAPIALSTRCTSTTVASALGSSTWTSPKPGLDTWWSIIIETLAVSSRAASAPSRAGSAASQATRTSGAAGTADGGHDEAEHVEGRRVSGISSGVANATRTVAPRRRRAMPSASALPSESASGWTWASSVTSAASASTSAAVRIWSTTKDAPWGGFSGPDGA